MRTVHEATYEVLRSLGMTTILAIPGRTNSPLSINYHPTFDTSWLSMRVPA